MVKKKPTIHDVAAQAGVTATTVSRVLNDYHYVSAKTREHVLQVIKELDYRPRQSARQLRTRSAGLFGLLTDDISITPYGYDIARGVQDAAWERNQFIVIVSVGREHRLIEGAVEKLLEREIEGIIYASAIYSAVELPGLLNEVPTVLANCYATDGRYTAFLPDERAGGYAATELLLKEGHKRIAFMNLTDDPIRNASFERQVGYKEALADYGVSFDEQLLRYTHHEPLRGYYLSQEMLDWDEPPSAFFCGNDRTALECYLALKERGLRIPDDIAVVGYDNYEAISERLHPPLTTVAIPYYQMGYQAMRYLYDNIDKGKAMTPVHTMIKCPPIIRHSV